MAFLVATTSLPAVYRPNDDRWNAARLCQFDQTLRIGSWDHFVQIQWLLLTTTPTQPQKSEMCAHIGNLVQQHLSWDLSISGISQLLLTFFRPLIFRPKFFDQNFFYPMFLGRQKLLWNKKFWDKHFLNTKFFWTKKIWRPRPKFLSIIKPIVTKTNQWVLTQKQLNLVILLFWHEWSALQSVTVRQSTGNDVCGPLFSPLFFPFGTSGRR